MAPRVRALLVNLVLAAVSMIFLLGVVEGTLRLSGFRYVLYPEDIEFGKPDPQLMKIGFLPDDDLFWVPKSYFENLRHLQHQRPPVVFMGDSCTHLGHYDRELAALFESRQGRPLVFGNVGVAGWSTFQGRRQLERDVLALEPRVVTMYYGWNDHWIGFGIEDKTVARVRKVFSSRISASRLVQLVTKATVAMGTGETAYPNRVSLEDFALNLRAMVRRAHSAGVEPMLITAASSHVRGQEPEYLGSRWLRDPAELVPLHRAYVDAVRRVAEQERVPLCDPAAAAEQLEPATLTEFFMADGIHLTEAGDRWLASVLYDCFETHGLLERMSRQVR